jgi:hypothetical protein
VREPGAAGAGTPRADRMEQLHYNLLYRWFVGLGVDDPVWVPTVFTKKRDRLLEAKVALQTPAILLFEGYVCITLFCRAFRAVAFEESPSALFLRLRPYRFYFSVSAEWNP